MNASNPPSDVAQVIDEMFGAPHVAQLTIGPVSIAPVTLGELPALLALLSHQERQDSGSPEEQEACARVMEFVSRQSRAFIATLSPEDQVTLLDVAYQANPTLFRKPSPGGRTRRGSSSSAANGLQESIALLLECGHSLAAIAGYTLAQIERLTLLHSRLAAERNINSLVVARAAQAETNGYKNFAAALKRARTMLG